MPTGACGPQLRVELSKPYQPRVPKLVSVPLPPRNVSSTAPVPPADDVPINLLSLLPPDAWDRLSFEEQQDLVADLPPLDGWWDLSAEDATAENLRQLFRGANFNFGNPLMSFYFPSDARSTARAVAKAAFDARKRVFTKQLLQSIIQNRTQCLKQVLPADELALNPELDISVIPPCKQALDDVDHSIFMAIRHALTSLGPATVDSITAHLETHAPRSIPPLSERPQQMRASHYIHSALLFLSRPVDPSSASPDDQDTSWSSPFVEHVATTNTFAWRREDGKVDADMMHRLLLLERLFRSPFDLVDPSVQHLQSALQLARKRHPDVAQHLVNGACTPPAKLPKVAPVSGNGSVHDTVLLPPSFVVKRANLPLHRQYPLLRDAFQQQELQRYQHARQPFIYFDGDSGFQTLVGPCFPPLSSDRLASAVLVPDVPPQVTVLNVVRDAVARLPSQCGTRADVLALFRMSMYATVQLDAWS
ncbi:hypothetical protein, variant 2 [Aphanomyces invadans]|uniref:Nuclear factor related to kappa-B-binding protein second winged helix domain-containing protein n=1 Tax=Aphanomyces invadans TaxID=157072 RepID=A0A024TWY6_9STRA|nr:hypothetical protein, variant 1 [Aphanomyces invadans]XP_008872725.1 hypothetical protein, variant 2 [Aphanomyces invadans]ETV98527.1 hypothetical protein, variant 1 [Aphanomyces invadans]ETV98528.1 hypothetical protein, variant 2 [Aphanomyces invadans]|eukprot:XP_008872724.1 hypothetical protein, variant 1 [Aphanomyces invadans]